MNETSPDYHKFSLNNICRICLSANGLHLMALSEKNWLSNLTNTSSSSNGKDQICYICCHFIRKCTQFFELCKQSHYILNELCQSSYTFQAPYNFTETKIDTFDITPVGVFDNSDVNDVIVAERDSNPEDFGPDCDVTGISDDETPLSSFTQMDKIKNRKKKKKSKKKDDAQLKDKLTETQPSSVEQESVICKARDGTSKARREGFSSRMKQEAEEYIVIKLTKEQVLSEMQSRALEERYIRAPYKCERCVLPYNFKDVLDKHMIKHSSENGSFQCELCSQCCPSAVSLRGHLKSHTTRYECKVCGAVRRARQHLLEHHHTAHSARPPRYECTHCPFNTTKRTVMQRHARVSHGSRPQLACPLCARDCRTLDALRVHVTRHDKSSSLSCDACPRRFVFASQLRKHRLEVHERRDHYCVECDLSFKSPVSTHTQLRKHRLEVHERRDHYCVECDLSFKSPYNLQLHFKRSKRHRDATSDVKKTS